MARPMTAAAPDRALVLSKAVAEVAKHLSISSSELAIILGISQSSASRLMRGEYSVRDQAKEWEMAALLVRLYRGLYSIVGNNDQLAQDWLNSPNLAFGNRVPFDIIQQASGLVHACDYIDAHRAPA
ncbi:MAG TPA: antitoxin Xre/MbcA/ParS toxin-binding domain-containing protein [Rhodocyclaceae bacterium]|nr:antitoxin Xre/MbcA/ParS toxin-binding domain-containing protein [Rhodocyclaceae bacterium]